MNSNGIITAPINAKADVATVLGESDASVSRLCKSNNINMWAKWKPIAYGSVTTPSQEIREKLNYGLTNFMWSGFSALIDLAKQPNGGIKYEGPNELLPQCRLGDFIGYNHNAPDPILNNNINVSTEALSNRVGNTFGISFFLGMPTEQDDNITLHSIQEIKDSYPAVMFCKKVGGSVIGGYATSAFWTSDQPLSKHPSTAVSLIVPVGNIPPGVYYIVVCFSKYKFNWSDNWTQAGSYPSINLAPLPLTQLETTSSKRVQITQYTPGGTEPGEDSFSWTCNAALEKIPNETGSYKLKWSISILDWGSDRTLSNNVIYKVHTDWQFGQSLDQGETYENLKTFERGVDGPGVVASGEDIVDANYSWKIYVGLGTHKYTKTAFALSPAP